MSEKHFFKAGPKSILIFTAKLALTALALYFVGKKVDLREIIQGLANLQIGWFVLGLTAFLSAKLISTYRLWLLFKSLGYKLDTGFNISVFFIGSFFNLFLPSSVGGDGVKAMLIVEKTDCRKRDALAAVFLDRLSGMAALVALTALMLILAQPQIEWQWLNLLFWPALVLAMPVYMFIQSRVFKVFSNSTLPVTLLSLLIQSIHLLSAWFLLIGLGGKERVLDYLSVFMASVSAAVVPITIGGFGIRELVSGYLGEALQLDKQLAVSLAFTYFIVILLSSLPGLPLMIINLLRKKA
jgi:uncharacterized membrane protein YbhN (UPF0104 family)